MILRGTLTLNNFDLEEDGGDVNDLLHGLMPWADEITTTALIQNEVTIKQVGTDKERILRSGPLNVSFVATGEIKDY